MCFCITIQYPYSCHSIHSFFLQPVCVCVCVCVSVSELIDTSLHSCRYGSHLASISLSWLGQPASAWAHQHEWYQEAADALQRPLWGVYVISKHHSVFFIRPSATLGKICKYLHFKLQFEYEFSVNISTLEGKASEGAVSRLMHRPKGRPLSQMGLNTTRLAAKGYISCH